MDKLFKTELHTHSKPASSCSDIVPEKIVEIYKEHGYDSIVLANHFTVGMQGDTAEEKIKWYLQDYYNCLKAGEEAGLNVILGAEIRFTENHNDYLVFGICPEDLMDIYKLLPYGIDNFYKEYKNEKNIIIQAHPFRDGMESVNPASLDGVEVFNMRPHHNSRNGLAVKFAEENKLIATCGNDFHHFGHECLCGIYTKEPVRDSFELSKILKNKEYTMFVGKHQISL